MRDGLGAVQRVLLLGGSSEIGLATVKELAKAGRLSHAFLAVRSIEGGEISKQRLLTELPRLNVTILHFDAQDPSTFQPMLDSAFADGPIDCVISAFGLLGNDVSPLEDIGGVERLIQVNYTAAVVSGTLVVQRFRNQGHGSLVVLSSVAAERSRYDNYVYASTKAGLDSWASGLSDALKGTGTDVIVVRPGFVHTKMTEGLPVAPLATTPEEVAVVIVEAIRQRKPLVWAPKTVRPLMSALRHLPRPVFQAVAKKAGN
jgi:decaprenylphospho-beta-D-erythro-pentofuranosid-2-ulose 2-reductase